MIEKLMLRTLLVSALLITANAALAELSRDQITDKTKRVWQDVYYTFPEQSQLGAPFEGLNKLLCMFNIMDYQKWANLQRDADTPAYAYTANIDERKCGTNTRHALDVIRATQLSPDDPLKLEKFTTSPLGAINYVIEVAEEATETNPFGILTLDQQIWNQTNEKLFLRQRYVSSRVDDLTTQYQGVMYLDLATVQVLPIGQKEETYQFNLYFQEGDSGYGTSLSKLYDDSELYPAAVPENVKVSNIAFNTDYIMYETYQDRYSSGALVSSKVLIESACVSRSNHWNYVPIFGYGVYDANGDKNTATFSAVYTNASNEVVPVVLNGGRLIVNEVCRALEDGSVVATPPPCVAGAIQANSFDVPDLTTVVRADGQEYIVRQLVLRKVYSKVDTSFCAGLAVRDAVPVPNHLFFEGHNLTTAVPAAGAMLVNDFVSDPDSDPNYAGKQYSPLEDSDGDGVLNYADMFPEDSTRSADLDYDGIADEIDVTDDRLKFDNLNFEYPDAIEYITPSMYQGE